MCTAAAASDIVAVVILLHAHSFWHRTTRNPGKLSTTKEDNIRHHFEQKENNEKTTNHRQIRWIYTIKCVCIFISNDLNVQQSFKGYQKVEKKKPATTVQSDEKEMSKFYFEIVTQIKRSSNQHHHHRYWIFFFLHFVVSRSV